MLTILMILSWIEGANAIVALISAVGGLITTGIPLFLVCRNLFKNKNKSQVWATLQVMAKAAVVEAEATAKTGAEKKEIALRSIKAACAAEGIDCEPFMNQLSVFIDSLVKTINDFNDVK